MFSISSEVKLGDCTANHEFSADDKGQAGLFWLAAYTITCAAGLVGFCVAKMTKKEITMKELELEIAKYKQISKVA